MLHEYSRMELLIGEDAVETLAKSRVAVFGIGGVGSYTAEALARCGVGVITLVDNDVVTLTNLNRQLVALHSTIGKPKTQVMKERIRDIDPHILVNTYETFFSPETEKIFDFSAYDYVVDAIDTVSAKLLLIEKAKAAETQIISCMGTGNKLDPSRFEITDISRTSVCPLAKVMRQELKRRRIHKVKVLYSREVPVKPRPEGGETRGTAGRPAPGSIAFVPSVAGLMIAGEVVRDLIRKNGKR
ncbi:MAG: tRNA threonylcarbamoyladenosine dehydratase [Clostridiales bacterium]|nr:tRNA threonylcarbamoyladenosine dehydratase [Clostridiales bacterium]